MIYDVAVYVIFPIIIFVLVVISLFRFYEIWKSRFDNKSSFIIKHIKFVFKSIIELFRKEQSLIQTLFVVFSIYLSVLTFINNQKQLEITDLTLKSSDRQFKKSDSISDLNIKLLNSLNYSSNSLLDNMNNLSGSISLFPQKIDSITQNLIALNNLINEQKKITENELKRAPLFSYDNFDFKDNTVYFDFINSGGISADITSIKVILFNKKYKPPSIFINERYAEIEENDEFIEYSIYFNSNTYRIFPKDKKKFSVSFHFDDSQSNYKPQNSINVVFRIGYWWIYDKYENFEFSRELKLQ